MFNIKLNLFGNNAQRNTETDVNLKWPLLDKSVQKIDELCLWEKYDPKKNLENRGSELLMKLIAAKGGSDDLYEYLEYLSSISKLENIINSTKADGLTALHWVVLKAQDESTEEKIFKFWKCYRALLNAGANSSIKAHPEMDTWRYSLLAKLDSSLSEDTVAGKIIAVGATPLELDKKGLFKSISYTPADATSFNITRP